MTEKLTDFILAVLGIAFKVNYGLLKIHFLESI